MVTTTEKEQQTKRETVRQKMSPIFWNVLRVLALMNVPHKHLQPKLSNTQIGFQGSLT